MTLTFKLICSRKETLLFFLVFAWNALRIKLYVSIFWVLQRYFFLINIHYTSFSVIAQLFLDGWMDFLVDPVLLGSLQQLLCTEQLVKLSKSYEIIGEQSISVKLASQSLKKSMLILGHIFRKKHRITGYLPDTLHFIYFLSFYLHETLRLELFLVYRLGNWHKEFNNKAEVSKWQRSVSSQTLAFLLGPGSTSELIALQCMELPEVWHFSSGDGKHSPFQNELDTL